MTRATRSKCDEPQFFNVLRLPHGSAPIPSCVCTETHRSAAPTAAPVAFAIGSAGPLFLVLMNGSICRCCTGASMVDAKDRTCVLSDIYFIALPPGASSISPPVGPRRCRVFFRLVSECRSIGANGLESQPPVAARNFPSPVADLFKMPKRAGSVQSVAGYHRSFSD